MTLQYFHSRPITLCRSELKRELDGAIEDGEGSLGVAADKLKLELPRIHTLPGKPGPQGEPRCPASHPWSHSPITEALVCREGSAAELPSFGCRRTPCGGGG